MFLNLASHFHRETEGFRSQVPLDVIIFFKLHGINKIKLGRDVE